jgi:hypothetical protein
LPSKYASLKPKPKGAKATKDKKKDPPTKTSDDAKEKALYLKGKGGKGKWKGNPKDTNQLRPPDLGWENNWSYWGTPTKTATPKHRSFTFQHFTAEANDLMNDRGE